MRLKRQHFCTISFAYLGPDIANHLKNIVINVQVFSEKKNLCAYIQYVCMHSPDVNLITALPAAQPSSKLPSTLDFTSVGRPLFFLCWSDRSFCQHGSASVDESSTHYKLTLGRTYR